MKKITRRKFIQKSILASIGLVLLDAFWFEKYVIDWNYYNITKPNTSPIKVIQISDLHINTLRYYHKSIAKKINKKQPDLVCITGDSVNTTEDIVVLNTFLNLIDTSIKKYAILGNWEYWGNVNLNTLKQVYANHNCELLINNNSTITIKNRTLAIIGIDDFVGGTANFNEACKNLKPANTTLVLSHCPEYTDIIRQLKTNINIDVVLSGHTHGGQITFLGYAPIKPKGSGNYLSGWYTNGNPKMYISKGIGTSVFPIRFGARAEMVELDI